MHRGRVSSYVAATFRRPPAGLDRARWAILLAALPSVFQILPAALSAGPVATTAFVAAGVCWWAFLFRVYRRGRLDGPRDDAVETLLLLVIVTIGAHVNIALTLGVLYSALFFRTAHATRRRLAPGVVVYLGVLVLGATLSDGLSRDEVTAIVQQAVGFSFVAFCVSVVVGSMMARGRELAVEQKLLGAVLDNLDVAVVACDRAGGTPITNAAARSAGLDARLLLEGDGAQRRVVVGAEHDVTLDSLPLRRALTGAQVRDQALTIEEAHTGVRREFTVNARPVDLDDDARGLVVAALHDVTDRKLAEERLERQALHDALTKLPNRVLLQDRLQHALRSAPRRGCTPAILFLDLDGFKTVNDTAGHDAGDHVLTTVAARLRDSLRDEDTLARLGGDEFAVLLEATSLEEAVAVARRLIEDATTRPIEVAGAEFAVAASVGVAVPDLDELRAGLITAADLLRNADLAMYSAKTSGKNRVEIFAEQMHEALLARVTLERDLRRALDNDEFVLYYQPVVSMRTGEAVGAEALLRWISPERGLVPPGDFIPLAESSGLIVPMGEWVLREACRQAAAWQPVDGSGLAGLHMAVNLSIHQLMTPGLVDLVRKVLEENALPPHLLVLEITESAFGDNDVTLTRLGELRSLGVQLAIDDFGTGYSSLTRLQMFPVDTVKIDRSFVSGIDANDTAPLVTATLALARAFGMSTVAEGVENETQERFLREQGCPVAQGFHYSRPVPGAEFTDQLRSQRPVIPAQTRRIIDGTPAARVRTS